MIKAMLTVFQIYSIVEAPPFTEDISNSLCVGRRRPQDRDEDVFLFVVMNPGHAFTQRLSDSIKQAIKTGLSPRHVPRFVLEGVCSSGLALVASDCG